MLDLAVIHIGELATPEGAFPKAGKKQGEVAVLHDVCIGVKDGNIAYIGPESGLPKTEAVLDAEGALVTPGLVDAHTHLVFGGWRQHEMEQKLAGVGYLDILAGGGGILSTVRSTRSASEEELIQKSEKLLAEMAAHGTTTAEAKSGYGLDLVTERKQLEVIRSLNERSGTDLIPTFMGAHAVPEEYKNNRKGYIKYLIGEMLPEIAKTGLAEFCDIFCETGVFDASEAKEILLAAGSLGFGLKIHADEIDAIGGGELAGELKAVSAEHLIAASDEGIRAMAKSGTIGVLLPATSFYLDKPFARARKMLEEGMAVAVASDFNPGSSPNLNLQFPMNLACLRYKLTPKEALTAVTLNAAAAIRRGHLVGSVEVGKQGDLVIWDAEDLNYLFYRYGSNRARHVIKKGKIIYGGA